MTQTDTTSTTPTQPFPFTIEDLAYFVIEREDGTIVKFTMDGKGDFGRVGSSTPVGAASPHYPTPSMSAWCAHNPAAVPTYTVGRGEGKPPLGIWIADAQGTRAHKTHFDLVIDGGDVLSIWTPKPSSPRLEGDPALCEALEQYAVESAPIASGPRILQIDWYDRKAPPLHPAFWPDLAQRLLDDESLKRVLVCCQGGHGRSGSTLVALMMCYTDYNSIDAITHLRAVHCARAIESIEQHEYLARLSAHLDRPCDPGETSQITDFKARFLTLTSPYAAPWQERLKGETK